MKYDAEFWSRRSVQKCAQNTGSNILKLGHILCIASAALGSVYDKWTIMTLDAVKE